MEDDTNLETIEGSSGFGDGGGNKLSVRLISENSPLGSDSIREDDGDDWLVAGVSSVCALDL